MRLAIFVIVVLCAGLASAQYSTKFLGDLAFTTFDGQTLHGDGYVPEPKTPGQLFPVVIFPNSWGVPQIEYIVPSGDLATEGFVTFEYETRGWYSSGGTIDVAGPLDRRDISTVIDFVLSHAAEWNINTSAIAMCGISYGAGLSIQAAGFEPRVKAIVALSGWANLTLALYRHNTVNYAWAELLKVTADVVGHPSPELAQMIGDLINHQNLSAVEEFALHRSALVNLSYINERRIPVFLANNFLDRLFLPNDMIAFWQQLQGPKYMLMNQGMHAEASIFGLIGLPSYTWTKAKMWLAQFMQGANTGILSEPPVQMQIEYQGNDYVMLNGWPDSAVVQSQKWLIGNRGSNKYGQLVAAPGPAPVSPGPFDSIVFSTSTGITNGIPLVSDAADEFVPTTNDLALYQQSGAVVYRSEPLQASAQLCGEPTFRIQFMPSSENWQLYALLYSVDGLDVGDVISDGYVSNYASGNGVWRDGATTVRTSTVAAPGGGAAMVVDVASTFHMMCRVVPAGNRVGLAFVLFNELYTAVNSQLGVVFQYTNESYVTLPLNP